MRKIFAIVILILLISNFSLASRKKNPHFIQVKGSDTMVNLAQSWAETYMEINQKDFIAVTGGGSGTGIASMMNGTCDIAMSSRDIKKKEIEMANKRGIKPYEIKVALDGLAVVVNRENPVDKLTMDQLADIFTGKITNWKQLGGHNGQIVLLSREVNSGTHVYFKEHVLRKGNSQGTEEFAPSALMLSSSQAIADEIAGNIDAIGYYGMGYISKNQKAVSVAKDPNSEYVPPTIDNVVSGKYPISRPMYLYTNGEPNGLTKKFIDFALSEKGQKIVVETDFVPISK
ncbi:MAG: phosphate ABC transporter substrate-binding protein [Phycisphaerales bacterium]